MQAKSKDAVGRYENPVHFDDMVRQLLKAKPPAKAVAKKAKTKSKSATTRK